MSPFVPWTRKGRIGEETGGEREMSEGAGETAAKRGSGGRKRKDDSSVSGSSSGQSRKKTADSVRGSKEAIVATDSTVVDLT